MNWKPEFFSGEKEVAIATLNLDILAIEFEVVLQILYSLIEMVTIIAESTLRAVRVYVVA